MMTTRLPIEALIERKVSEAELIEAAYRALLAQLSEDRLDGTVVPLFSEPDGLAELIAEAQRPGGDA